MRPGLLLWGGGSAAEARARRAAGARVLAWPGSDPSPLAAAGVPFEHVLEALGAEGLAAVEAAPLRWARVWARLPLADGRSFRDLVGWRGESLLWVAEGFLREQTAGPRCARTVELCHQLFEALAPSEIDACGLPAADTALVARSAVAAGVLFHGEEGSPRALPVRTGGRARRAWRLGLFARAPRPAWPPTGAALVLVVDDAEGGSRAADLCDALRLEPAVATVRLGLPDLDRLGAGREGAAAREAAHALARTRDALRGTPALAAAYRHRGVAFADLAGHDLDALLCGHLPRAVERLERALALFTAARAAAVVVGLATRDDRRALGLAAHAAGVPWLVFARPDDPADPERADFGPQPAAVLPAEAALAVAQVRAAMRGSVGPE